MLEERVGTWDAETTITPAPGAQPIPMKGVSSGRMMGPWLIVDYESDSGFKGHGVYARQGDKIIATWVDTAMASFARGEGAYVGKTLTLDLAAQHEGKTIGYREIWTKEGETIVYRNLVGDHEMIRSVYRKRHA
jgi:hypothetical protein